MKTTIGLVQLDGACWLGIWLAFQSIPAGPPNSYSLILPEARHHNLQTLEVTSDLDVPFGLRFGTIEKRCCTQIPNRSAGPACTCTRCPLTHSHRTWPSP